MESIVTAIELARLEYFVKVNRMEVYRGPTNASMLP